MLRFPNNFEHIENLKSQILKRVDSDCFSGGVLDSSAQEIAMFR